MFPFERDIARFYKYFFEGVKDPIIVSAKNKVQADIYLATEMAKFPQLDGLKVVDFKISSPIYGVTKFVEKGVTLVWAGEDKSASGWLTENEFEQLNEPI